MAPCVGRPSHSSPPSSPLPLPWWVQPRAWALACVSLVTVCRPCGCQLLFVRDDLLSGDYGTALARLMKFPEVADPTVLLDKAAELRDREYRPPTYVPGRRARSHAIRQGLTTPAVSLCCAGLHQRQWRHRRCLLGVVQEARLLATCSTTLSG